jgi:hypothetical protein
VVTVRTARRLWPAVRVSSMKARKPPPGWQGMVRIQQETQTVCPLKETGFLPGTSGRPRWASTCFLNSSEEIERREDRISCIRSSLISGRMVDFGLWVAFTGHEDSGA